MLYGLMTDSRQAYELVVWNDNAALENLSLLSGIEVRNHPIKVRGATSLVELDNTDVLYIPESQLDQLAALVSQLQGDTNPDYHGQ